MPYPTVLFDLDHTLFDTDASEAAAFSDTVGSAGVDDPSAVFEIYDDINQALWRGVERGETTPNELRVTRWERFVDAIGLDVDPVELADAFVGGLGAFGELYDGALAVLDEMAGRTSLSLITNGLGPVQRSRIERLGLADYFDAVVISAEIGISKPATGIFDVVFAELGEPDRSGAVIVGDSLSSDMAGGVNAGIDTCWYNPSGGSNTSGLALTLEVSSLAALPPALLRSAKR